MVALLRLYCQVNKKNLSRVLLTPSSKFPEDKHSSESLSFIQTFSKSLVWKNILILHVVFYYQYATKKPQLRLMSGLKHYKSIAHKRRISDQRVNST